MKKDNWLFVLIAVLLLITLMHGADAQDKPLKNKYKIKVELKSTRQVSGLLLEASQDSLIIGETKRIVVGSQVKVFLTEDYFLSGEVVDVSDTTVVLKSETSPTNQVIRFARIKEITTRSYPPGFDAGAPVRTSVPVSQIARIRIAESGRRAVGFFVGALVGYEILYESYSGRNIGPETYGEAMLVTLAVPVGGLIGLALADGGGTYKIAGDSVSYSKFLKKVK